MIRKTYRVCGQTWDECIIITKNNLYIVPLGAGTLCSVHFIPGSFHSLHRFARRFRSFHSLHSCSFHSRFVRRFRSFHSLIRHFTGFARSFHFIPFTRFTDSLASLTCSFHSRFVRSLINTNSNSSSYHHSPASPAYPRLHLSPQTGTTPSATCPFQTAGCPA